MKANIIKNLSKLHFHNGIRYGFSKKFGWLLFHKDSHWGWGWIPCVPSHIKTPNIYMNGMPSAKTSQQPQLKT